MDLESIKRNYENFDNDKLIRIATKEISSLRKEVIPILEAELKKRNISIETEEENKDEEKAKTSQNGELFSDEFSEFMNSFEIPNILKSGKRYYINSFSLLLISFLFSLVFVFNPMFGAGSRLILFTVILIFILTIVLRKIGIGKLAEIQQGKIILLKYPAMNFGYFRILILLLVAFNGLRKLEFDFKTISDIYQKKDLTDKGYYIEVIDNLSKRKNNYRIFLEMLTENDRKQVIGIIKQKMKENNA